uniref:TNFR-Cys domain-containing protein n=1 Tax=Globodera pallida TaxID=36090 RepID=A0A183CKK6_GLOPA
MRVASAFSPLLFMFLIHRITSTTLPSSHSKAEDDEKDGLFTSNLEESAEVFSSDSADSSPLPSSSSEEGGFSSGEEEFVENVAGWRPPPFPPFSVRNICPKGKFFEAKTDECRPCSICGPDLYEREKCRPDRDTVCDWCLTNLKRVVRSSNFRVKCEQLIALREQFRSALVQRSVVGGKPKSTLFSEVSVLESTSKWWKVELFVEMAFYVTLIALVLAVTRFLVKSRPTAYRTVTVTPPMLEEWEQKNIIHAAESIREKMGSKGYAKLEEEFI